MPYENDDWLKEIESVRKLAERRVALENEANLRAELRRDFNIPDDFMDVAVQIWWAGKES